ncbi:hypothetical protein D3C81_2049510 [compost metagenome]
MSRDIDRMSNSGHKNRVCYVDIVRIPRPDSTAVRACVINCYRIITSTNKDIIDVNIVGGKCINSIPPFHVTESFKVIDENIGGIS